MTAGLKVPADSQEVPEGVIAGSVETRFHRELSSRTRCAAFADDTQMRKQLRPAKNSLRMRSFIVAAHSPRENSLGLPYHVDASPRGNLPGSLANKIALDVLTPNLPIFPVGFAKFPHVFIHISVQRSPLIGDPNVCAFRARLR